nr:MAG TPA: hypothetical protein [Caudoviricetes sp.]
MLNPRQVRSRRGFNCTTHHNLTSRKAHDQEQ